MKATNLLKIEFTRATKSLLRSTRKIARIRGGGRHPGLVQTAHAGRDVALASSGIILDFGSLGLLYSQIPFGLGICGGLVAFDIAGAAMKHYGTGDRHWREAQISVAESTEDQAAIRAQRPRRYAWINALGKAMIAVPAVYKIGGLVLSGALPILGGLGPALIVSYGAVAVIHWSVTGHAFAYLRTRRAEKKELNAMLRSSTLTSERDQHENRVKVSREHHFISPAQLVAIENVDGHALKCDGKDECGYAYRLITRGRLEDDALDTMVQRQKSAVQQATLYREGLKHQIEIEESEPMTAISTESDEDEGTAQQIPASPAPRSLTPVGSAACAVGRAAAVLAMGATMLGLTSCKPPKPEHVRVQIVAVGPQATGADQPLPEKVTAFAAPEKPLGGKSIPVAEIIRLDTPEPQTTPLNTTSDDASGVKKTITGTWNFQSPELELSKVREGIMAAKAGILATASGGAKLAHDRLAVWAKEAIANGTVVFAVGIALRGQTECELAPGIKVPAFEKAEDAVARMDEQMKSGTPPKSLAVVLDPPLPAKKAEKSPVPVKGSSAKTAPKAAPAPKPNDATVPPASPTPQVQTPKGDTIIVEVRGTENTNPAPPIPAAPPILPAPSVAEPESTNLPKNVVPVGPPIRFASNSANPGDDGRRAVKEAAEALRKMGHASQMKLFLRATADARPSSKGNYELSKQRAEAVEAALLDEGFVVTRTCWVGDNLSKTGVSETEMHGQRVVQIFAVPPDAKTGDTAPTPLIPAAK